MKRIFLGVTAVALGVTVLATRAWSGTSGAANAPAIHIVREGRNLSQLETIKQARKLCVEQKKMFQDMRRTNPSVWRLTEADLKKKRPQYDVDRAIAPEPEWTKVAVDREEEYFLGERYALYKKSARYKVTDDGSCSLSTEPRERAKLDDGTFLYDLDLVQRKGTKRMSGAVARSQIEQRLAADSDDRAATVAAMKAAGFPQAATALQGALTVSGHDTVAGECCDIVGVQGRAAENCYWSKMHHYPAAVRRPIILRSEVDIGGKSNVTEAVKFETPARIDSRVFEPPSGVSLRDATRRGQRSG